MDFNEDWTERPSMSWRPLKSSLNQNRTRWSDAYVNMAAQEALRGQDSSICEKLNNG